MKSKAEQVKDLIVSHNVKSYNAKKVFKRLEEFINTEEFKNVYDGFQGIERRIKVLKMFKFNIGYITENGDCYYSIKDGDYDYYHFNKFELGSSLNNGSLNQVLLFEDSFLVSHLTNFSKSDLNYKYFSSMGMAVCSSYMD